MSKVKNPSSFNFKSKVNVPSKCKTCKYRASNFKHYTCDYLLLTGSMRNCDANNCTKYKKGDRIKVNNFKY